jgi:hypothetical protein
MSIKLSALAHMVEGLSPAELTEFRRWFAHYEPDGREAPTSAGAPSAADAAAAPRGPAARTVDLSRT